MVGSEVNFRSIAIRGDEAQVVVEVGEVGGSGNSAVREPSFDQRLERR